MGDASLTNEIGQQTGALFHVGGPLLACDGLLCAVGDSGGGGHEPMVYLVTYLPLEGQQVIATVAGKHLQSDRLQEVPPFVYLPVTLAQQTKRFD